MWNTDLEAQFKSTFGERAVKRPQKAKASNVQKPLVEQAIEAHSTRATLSLNKAKRGS